MSHLQEILCVDDQEGMLDYLSRSLSSAGFEVVTCPNWTQAQSMLAEGKIRPDLIFVDPIAQNGKSVSLREICEHAGRIPVVALSASRDPRTIVQAIQEGACDYVCKPFTTAELRQVVSNILAGHNGERAEVKAVPPAVHFICESRSMQEVRKTALRVAKSQVPVLITGETGVGKDVVARFIHKNSNLADRPFVKVNCAAMPLELVESELFGYRKGAFTGAYIDRPGKFEFANHGTIFLDEIAEFTSSVQAKLLQVLQDGQFARLGCNEDVQVHVRVVAATNRKLEAAIKEGKFREDLYYRLNVVNINVGPLRHRKEDIPSFCEFFLAKYAKQYESDISEIPGSLMDALEAYDWPGNVRELENIVKRYVVLQDAESIETELRSKVSESQSAEIEQLAEQYVGEGATDANFDLKEVTRRAVSQVERNMIVRTLQRTNWNKSKAAKELRVSYKTLLTKIDQYNIVR